MKLTRYWFVIYPQNRFGPGNFGVTADSVAEARQLIIDTINAYLLQESIINLDENTVVIEHIDIRLLDQGHVIPNMGVVTFKGVWYPNLNMR